MNREAGGSKHAHCIHSRHDRSQLEMACDETNPTTSQGKSSFASVGADFVMRSGILNREIGYFVQDDTKCTHYTPYL